MNNQEQEIWKDIEEFKGFYQVSSLGRVRRISNKKYFIRKPSLNIYGYYQVRLSKRNNVKTRLVHRLVALAFIPNKLNKSEINHKNAIKTDNRVENLEWCTRQENQEHVKNNALYQTSNNILYLRRYVPVYIFLYVFYCNVYPCLVLTRKKIHTYRALL